MRLYGEERLTSRSQASRNCFKGYLDNVSSCSLPRWHSHNLPVCGTTMPTMPHTKYSCSAFPTKLRCLRGFRAACRQLGPARAAYMLCDLLMSFVKRFEMGPRNGDARHPIDRLQLVPLRQFPTAVYGIYIYLFPCEL